LDVTVAIRQHIQTKVIMVVAVADGGHQAEQAGLAQHLLLEHLVQAVEVTLLVAMLLHQVDILLVVVQGVKPLH
jgi:hypothetical protein